MFSGYYNCVREGADMLGIATNRSNLFFPKLNYYFIATSKVNSTAAPTDLDLDVCVTF